MALDDAHGHIAWNSADAVSTTYTVSGLPFEPKALIFLIMGLASGTDTTSGTTSARVCFGFAKSTSDRRCMGFLDVDAAAAADTQEIYRDDAVIATVDAAGAVDGRLDLNAVNSDGFQLIVDDTAPVNLRVFWFAWGGSDIRNVAIAEIAEPAATGSVNYTVSGWDPTCRRNVYLFAGCQLTGAAPTAAVADAGLSFGVMTTYFNAFASQEGWGIGINNDEGSATMDADSVARDIGGVIRMIAQGGGLTTARADFTALHATGFTLNWLARAVTNRRYMYLVIQGGQWYSAPVSVGTLTVGNTQNFPGGPTTNVFFEPKGALVCGRAGGMGIQGSDASVPVSVLGVGGWTSTSSRQSMGIRTNDGTANCEVNLAIEYDQCLVVPDSAAGIDYSLDIDAILPNGFRFIVDNASASVSTTVFGLMWTDDPPVYIQPVQGIRSLGATIKGFWQRAARTQQRIHSGHEPTAAPEEPPTWTQPQVPGIGALRQSMRDFWQQAARAAVHGSDFTFTPAEPDTATQDVQGIGSLRTSQRSLWQRAVQAILRFGSADDFVQAEPDTWTQPEVPGTGSLKRHWRDFWQRAARPSVHGDFQDAPVPPQTGVPVPLPGRAVVRTRTVHTAQAKFRAGQDTLTVVHRSVRIFIDQGVLQAARQELAAADTFRHPARFVDVGHLLGSGGDLQITRTISWGPEARRISEREDDELLGQ